jgi:uncharacterized protein YaaQ
MATTLKKNLAACALALVAAGLCAPPASAAPEKNHPKATDALKAKGKKAKSHAKSKKQAAAAAPAALAADEAEPDITDTVTNEYNCELGNKITIYTNENDAAHIALRWKKRLHRLTRVGTTTGALRFENPTFGLIWIGIPSKGILLDSKLNRQLANECKNAEQAKPLVVAKPEVNQADAGASAPVAPI